MESLALAVGFVVLAAILFVASVRLGMLVGRRLDRAIAPQTPAPASSPAGNAAADGRTGREENRGE